MAGNTLRIGVRIEGARETLNAFRKLPKEASAELRKASQVIAERVAVKARHAGESDAAPQSPLPPATDHNNVGVPALAC